MRSRRTCRGSIGGAADLAPSTKTRLTFEGAGDFRRRGRSGRNLHFGDPRARDGRGAQRPGAVQDAARIGSGFLIFSDYGRPAIRLGALMEIPVDLHLHARLDRRRRGWADPSADRAARRPARGSRTHHAAARRCERSRRSLARDLQRRHEPVALILTRQAVPTLDRTRCAACSRAARGAYVLADRRAATPEVFLLATGSEVALCVEAHAQLEADGVSTAW